MCFKFGKSDFLPLSQTKPTTMSFCLTDCLSVICMLCRKAGMKATKDDVNKKD